MPEGVKLTNSIMNKSELFLKVEAAYDAAVKDERHMVNPKFAGSAFCEELFLTMLGRQGVGHVKNAAGKIAILGNNGHVYLWWGMKPEFLDDLMTWDSAYICGPFRDFVEFSKLFSMCYVQNYADLAILIHTWDELGSWNEDIFFAD
jgi:hypothetical protein